MKKLSRILILRYTSRKFIVMVTATALLVLGFLPPDLWLYAAAGFTLAETALDYQNPSRQPRNSIHDSSFPVGNESQDIEPE